MVQQAQDLRTKVLTDLTNRRRVLHLQIEQLRAGRERLSETIQGARQSVDDIADELLRAEDEARLAAEAAGRTAAGLPDHEPDEALPAATSDSSSDEVPGAHEPAVEQSAGPGADKVEDVPGVVESSADESTSTDTAFTDSKNGVGRDRQVEDLFARLRASSVGDGPGKAEAGNESAQPDEATASGVSEPSLRDSVSPDPQSVGSDLSESRDSTQRVGPVLVTGAERSAEGGGATSTTGTPVETRDEPTLVLERPLQLVRRDELLGPVTAGLARRVKRALQDDQNDILDRLRSQGGWKEGVLPELSEHTARYVEASKEMLAEAARAGSTFAGVSIEVAADVSGEAAELASALVGPLRRRLEEDCPTVDPTDDAALVEHVGAAFREWRGDRTERLAGDYATSAFSASAVAGTSSDATICWVVDDEGTPCADCEDNALAEDVSPGDPFPTGHPHPPAHSGCRCLLVVRAT